MIHDAVVAVAVALVTVAVWTAPLPDLDAAMRSHMARA